MIEEVEGSISNDDNYFFNLPNPFNRSMALGFTQSLTEINTIKRGQRVRLTI
jgi:hypothetical protein